MHIIIAGNPIDGFELYGPFDTHEDAEEWATNAKFNGPDWWTVEPIDPNS